MGKTDSLTGKTCAICGRPAWSEEAERKWFNRNTYKQETIKGYFCIYHHPDHEAKRDEFWDRFFSPIFKKNAPIPVHMDF